MKKRLIGLVTAIVMTSISIPSSAIAEADDITLTGVIKTVYLTGGLVNKMPCLVLTLDNEKTFDVYYDGGIVQIKTNEIQLTSKDYKSDMDGTRVTVTGNDLLPGTSFYDICPVIMLNAEITQENKAESEISVEVNGETIKFDQPPINKEGNLLVPIRMIAEAMGKTVLWSDASQTAFIDNGENALIIPIGEMQIYLGDDSPYDQWAKTQLLVPSEVISGRTLVPIRQFCESLGANVSWDQNSQTAYITYDAKTTEKMDFSLFDSINLNYYIGRCTVNPFKYYTDTFIEPFYSNRNRIADGIAMGISGTFDVPADIWADIERGSTNASIAIQEALFDVINSIDDADASKVYEVDTSLLKDIKSYVSTGKTLYTETDAIRKDFLDNHPSLKPLNDKISSVVKSKGFKNGIKIFDYSLFTAEEIAYLLSDYSTNVGYLDVFEQALKDVGAMDTATQKAIYDLRDQYTEKFAQCMYDIQDKVINEGLSATMKIYTGGAYSLGKFVWNTIFSITGVNSRGESLKNFYAIYCYNAALDRAFTNCFINAKNTKYELTYLKALIEFEKATKKAAIGDIASTANWIDNFKAWWNGEPSEEETAESIKQDIDSITYRFWNYPYTIYHSPQRLD